MTNGRTACSPPAPGARPPYLACLLLILAGTVAYSNSFHGPFVFDDITAIEENPTLLRLGALDRVLSPPLQTTAEHRPLLNLTLAVNVAISGLEVWSYHALNLAVHLLAALLLFGILRRSLELPPLAERYRGATVGLALSVSLLWVLHPLQTESVTYVIQRAESLAGLFYLAVLYGAIRGAGSTRPLGWHVAAVACCVLGAATKETLVTAPALVLLYDRIFLSPSFREAWRRRTLLHAGLWAICLLHMALLFASGGHRDSIGLGHGVTPWDYAQTQLVAIVHYLRLSFWPAPLVLDYGQGIVRDPLRVASCAALIAALLAATVLAFRRRPELAFLGAGFFAILAPSSSVVPIATQTMAEHRMYLSLAAVVTLTVLAAWRAWTHAASRLRWPGAWSKALPAVALAAAAAALGAATFRRNEDYRSHVAIWQDTIRKRPDNLRAHLSLGVALKAAGDLPEALRTFDAILAREPGYDNARNNRGNVLVLLGRHDEALADFDRAIGQQPSMADYYANRGIAHQRAGRLDPALQDHSRAVQLRPDHAPYYSNRAVVYERLGRFREAVADCDRALDLHPAFTPACFNRGNALMALGRLDEALADYDETLRRKPDFAEAHCNRGNLHMQAGRLEQALADYDRAIALKPEYAKAWYNRAVAHFLRKDFARAWEDVRRCRALGFTPLPAFLQSLREKSGQFE